MTDGSLGHNTERDVPKNPMLVISGQSNSDLESNTL